MNLNCVILIHGLGRLKSSMTKLEKAFTNAGFDVVNWSYSSTKLNITDIAHKLYDVVKTNSENYSNVYFVTHSLGGIVVRRMMAIYKINNLGGIVMIAPPNNSSAFARWILKYPIIKTIMGPAGQELMSQKHIEKICAVPKSGVMVIAGTKSLSFNNPNSWISQTVLKKPHDGTVTVEETKLPNMEKFISVIASHTFIASIPVVIKETVEFLKNKSLFPRRK
ncbi:MAG: alpha/beta hydrolase [archaeon]|nr:alpha/beta hydrolase [archaeon]